MDAPSKRTITRVELYEQVWKRPTTLMAQEFGLSDVGFAKLCKRNGIPRPPRGYWAMLQVGRAPSREALPMPDRDWEIDISRYELHRHPEPSATGEVAKTNEKLADEQISVAETLHHAHSLIRASAPVLRVAQCSPYGLIIPVPGCVCVSVSRARLRRALLIMDALIQCFERRGYSVACPVEDDELCETRVSLMGVEVPFRIDEFLVEKGGGSPGMSAASESFRLHGPCRDGKVSLSGRLQLSIDEDRCNWCVRWKGFRLRWNDGKYQRVEDLLGAFVSETVRVATFMKTKKEEYAKREQERQLEEERKAAAARRRQEMIARVSEERRRVEELQEEATNWNKSLLLRRYIEAVRQSAVARGLDAGPDSETGKWLAWASQQADRLDPLTDSPPSVLDEAAKYKEERPVIFGGYGIGAATQAQDDAQLKSEFFRKRWLYDRFHGKSR